MTGMVKGFPVATRALVEVSGGIATICAETTGVSVDLDHVVTAGMEVSGDLDLATRRLDIRGMLRPAAEALGELRVGEVISTRIASVDAARAEAEIYPGFFVIINVAEVTTNSFDNLTSLLSPGETIAARLVATDPHWRLSLLDVDDDEIVRPGPPLLLGGPPWLDPPLPPGPGMPAGESPSASLLPQSEGSSPEELALMLIVSEPVDSPDQISGDSTLQLGQKEPHRPTPALLRPGRAIPASSAAPERLPPRPLDSSRGVVKDLTNSLHSERAKAAQLTDRVVGLEESYQVLKKEHGATLRDLAELRTERDRLQSELRTQRTRLRRSQNEADRRKGTLESRAPYGADWLQGAFLDPELRLRFELHLTWAWRVQASDKASRPLPDFTIGPHFIESLEVLEGITREKVLEVMVDLLILPPEHLTARGIHRLRENDAGGAPPVTRASDGAYCMRAALQINSPSARRIHYWKGSGPIEFSRVVTHDDFQP